METDKTLDKLEKDLAAMLSDEPQAEMKDFATKAEFLTYCKEQITLAKAEKDPEIQKARLTHLLVNVGIVQKNGFEDTGATSLPIFSGPLSVQAQTAWKERSESETSPQAASASGEPGPLGFAQKDGKPLTINDLLSAFDQMLSSPEGDEAKKKAEEEAAKKKAEGEAGAPEGEEAKKKAEEEAAKKKAEGEEAAATAAAAAAAKLDPWGTGLDMNFAPSEDKDEFAGGIRGY